MGLLVSCWFIIESVLVPDGFAKWHRLSFFIHPFLLVACQLFLVAKVLVRWVLLILVTPLRVIVRVILAAFRLSKGWVIGLILVAINSVTPSERSANQDEEYFHDCQEWEDAEIESDPTRSIVPCDQWHDADHEAGNPCRSIVVSSNYASFPHLLANVTVQLCQETRWFMEEGCFEQDEAEDKKEAAEMITSCADEDQKREVYSSMLHENVLPASETWNEEFNGAALPNTLQMGGSAEGERNPVDSDVESERAEEELDAAAFPTLRFAGREGVAEEPDPAAFINYQLDAGEELEVRQTASPFWPVNRNEDEDASGEDYALQAPGGTSLAIRTERDEQHDVFYKQYMERMGWFDRLNCERIHQARALLNMNVEDPSFNLEIVEAKISSIQGTTVRDLIKSVESDLERVYVAQSCLGWAVLHHQYRAVESLASSSSAGLASSCGSVTGKFQQFRVLLERYMENECRQVKRFWNYSRSRFCAVNLLQVPDVSGFGADAVGETTTASDMLEAIEKAIQVFWNFLQSDNCRPSGKLKTLLGINSQLEDPRDVDLLEKLKKEVRKDKQLKDLQKTTRRRWWKKTTPTLESRGIEILFSLIEVKLVSRVLRMSSVSTHQLGWCQDMLENIEMINKGRVARFCNGTFLFPSS